MTTLIGIDTGGTFTDFIVYDNGQFSTLKIASTPHAPEQAILTGLQTLGLDTSDVRLIHGTTVATNALLEGQGARTAFITNKGFKDLLIIGRQARSDIYSLCPQPTHELIDPELCFELDCRVTADGEHISKVSTEEVNQLCKVLQEQGVESIAICLLFAFLNNNDEKVIADGLKHHFFTSYSSQLLPEQREYERGMITWLNSFLGPKTKKYLSELQNTFAGQALHVMQSDATTLPAEAAALQPVRLLLSGPAGGVVAAAAIGKQTTKTRLLTLDMGGTSTDVAMIEVEPSISTELSLAEIPLALPMLDIHTIGAGGGSIAKVDVAGGLHVGPQSAGAVPGPACYLRGGKLPTVTDANVVLGRLPVLAESDTALQVDKAAAEKAIASLADTMQCSLNQAAVGVVSMANAHMAQALRVISIHRGYDPKEFCLFPFGGSGTLHMCEIASLLGMQEILVPTNAGVLSAYGMLLAPLGQFASNSICRIWHELESSDVEKIIIQLEQQAVRQLQQQNITASQVRIYLELRYYGQSATLEILWLNNFSEITATFNQLHEKQFGYALTDYAIELVTVRVWAYQEVEAPPLPKLSQKIPGKVITKTKVIGEEDQVPIFMRKDLALGQKIPGPSIIIEHAGTIFIAAGWSGKVDRYGHLHLQMHTEHR